MRIGTAGYTAMLCCNALRDQGVKPESGPIIVSGATGGVGSIAVNILAKRGYEVHALSGKADQNDYLTGLGAKAVIDRAEYAEKARPLGQQIWAGAVDVAGSHTLANIIANTQYGGVVTACGLAQGMDLPQHSFDLLLHHHHHHHHHHQHKYTDTDVIPINGSAGSAKPRSGSKSVSISKNAMFSLGAS